MTTGNPTADVVLDLVDTALGDIASRIHVVERVRLRARLLELVVDGGLVVTRREDSSRDEAPAPKGDRSERSGALARIKFRTPQARTASVAKRTASEAETR